MDLSGLSNAVTLTGTLLVHSVWQGLLIGLLHAVASLLLARRGPHVRYAVAVGCLAAFALAPVVTLVVLLSGKGVAPALPVVGASLPIASLPSGLSTAYPLLVSFWLAGVAVLGLRLAWNWRRAERLTHLGCHALPPQWQGRLESLAAAMGVRRRVTIAESVLVSVPVVIGWLKPVILIPSSALLGLSRRQLELVIAHELAHVRRYDYVVNTLLLAVETLFFYHPGVYLIGRAIRRERELCCDDLVVSRCGDRVEYVTALTDLETLRSRHVLTEPLSNLAATGGDLVHRVERIVRGRTRSNHRVYAVTAMLAMVLVAGVASLTQPEPARLAAVADVMPFRAPDLFQAHEPRAPEALAVPMPRTDVRYDVPREHSVSAGKSGPNAVASMTQTGKSLAQVADGAAPAVSEPLAQSTVAEAGANAPEAVPEAAPFMASGEPERAGPTRAMISELDLAQPVLDTVYDLQRDAHAALAVGQSPYVIVGPDTEESDFVVSDIADPIREEGGALIKRIEPRYPHRARLRGYTDTVQIQFRVTDTGDVSDITVVSTNSRSAFKRAVIRAVRKWRYEPLLRDGVAVERTLVKTFAFRLEEPDDASRGTVCGRDEHGMFSCATPGLIRAL